jgi:hypothetical protein
MEIGFPRSLEDGGGRVRLAPEGSLTTFGNLEATGSFAAVRLYRGSGEGHWLPRSEGRPGQAGRSVPDRITGCWVQPSSPDGSGWGLEKERPYRPHFSSPTDA